MKKIVQLVLSLTVIAAVCAAVLATVDSVTKVQIATIKARATQNAARLVMPASVKEVEQKSDGGGDYFVGKGANGQPIAYALKGTSRQGYGGSIVLMVGFLPDRTIVTYQKLEAAETPGLGSNLTSENFMKQFKGMPAAKDISVKKDGGNVEAITSATITSRAVCGAINAARARLDGILAR
ncbi:MAG: RnfABCDGE type electron transport complex subunit G [Kiritimatiellae bacterium]|jgi:electron transport complex protein RnfG|nr:RnfABCDGE type electron transport complex subunit G [Kiritimatiellia bacterium]